VVKDKSLIQFLESSSFAEGLSELAIDRAEVLRAISALKADFKEVSPQAVALELGIPRSFIYQDLEILDLIFRNAKDLSGSDKLISELISKYKSLSRKHKSQSKELEKIKSEFLGAFNDGFAKGAAMNFSSVKSEIFANQGFDHLEQWARGVLHLELAESLNEAKIKKNYRFLLGILHPDRSGVNTTDGLANLKKAYDYLLDKYE
jgi:hypothetical protein